VLTHNQEVPVYILGPSEQWVGKIGFFSIHRLLITNLASVGGVFEKLFGQDLRRQGPYQITTSSVLQSVQFLFQNNIALCGDF